MAVIKCPECGHEISDMAPTCPNCGVKIQGNLVKCPSCGEVYLIGQPSCPKCGEKAPKINPKDDKTTPTGKGNHHRGRTFLIVIIIFLIIILAGGGFLYYYYSNAKQEKEQSEYEFALTSKDAQVLQSYIDNFPDAPSDHLDIIKSHLKSLNTEDSDWTNAVMNGTKAALSEFLQKYPDTPHEKEILLRIDSIDWDHSVAINSSEAYKSYIDNHYDGQHYDEAVAALKKVQAAQLNSTDEMMISNIFHNFFSAISARDEESLVADVGDNINLLEKADATKNDVIAFMNKLYKPDVAGMIWSLSDVYDITKTETPQGGFQYAVQFRVKQDVQTRDDKIVTTIYRVNANINSGGKITRIAMTKIVDEPEI